ncbi:hypothetical protein KHA90_04415 [Flavobacterium psychroterrae]|uniref:Uncharacterized protein n=1 Tax=Flavobacterium psychroterrae TaxID=2133767 RepID=A0ABS5P8U7_9FLAO|nr:hypothetical protein [Flavobacterium psychroterrae]MBS7230260.1 hypothetical protein [Flavobacterium psychroterrae]
MEFNFNVFFGYEDAINSLNDKVLIYGFASIVFGIVALLFFSFIIRKLGLDAINSYFINPLMLSLGLTMFVSILPTIVFYVVALDLPAVKIVYSWIAIFIGMFLFVSINLKTIKSVFKESNKVSQQEEFRNRNR